MPWYVWPALAAAALLVIYGYITLIMGAIADQVDKWEEEDD